MSVHRLQIHTEQTTNLDRTYLYTYFSLTLHRTQTPMLCQYRYNSVYYDNRLQGNTTTCHFGYGMCTVPLLLPCYILILLSTNSDTKYVLGTTFSNWHLYVFKHLLSSTGDNAINNIDRWARVDVLPDVSCRFFRS